MHLPTPTTPELRAGPEPPVRVLHVISGLDPESGGPTTALMGLAAAQAAVGMDVRVLCPWQRESSLPNVELLRQAGIQVEAPGPTHGRFNRHAQIRPLAREMAARADVVHIHGLFEDVQHEAARAARRAGKPHIFRPCGMLDPWSLRQSRWVKRAYFIWRLDRDLKAASALHAMTQIEAQNVHARLPTQQVIIEPNGINIEEFKSLPERGVLRRRLALTQEQPVALFLSRLHYKKGLDLLILAWRQVVRHLGSAGGNQPVLLIAGPDTDGYGQVVRELVRTHDLEASVRFIGMVAGRERLECYRDADVFVLPSYQENFGIVVVEALAAGTPVLISDQVALHPNVSGAHAGEVIPLSADAIGTTLSRWLVDRTKSTAAGEAGRRLVLDHFDWHRIAGRWIGHYRGLVGSAHRH